jgi:16S rRNA (cytosine1402-N4)-methyltransferase
VSIHKSVLLKETVEMLNLKEGSVVVDATLGGGGHSREIVRRIGKTGKLIAMDADHDAIKKFETQYPELRDNPNIFLINDNFSNLDKNLERLKIEKVDAIMADLGWSSDQLEGRGMSFLKEEPLDMRLDREGELDAKTVVNEYGEAELGRIIRDYGEEKFWKSITKKIISRRKEKQIETTTELAELISSAVPPKFRRMKLNPATKTFQAIRIEVNGELANLENFLPQAIAALSEKGRLAIISFHSLEDRIVKIFFRENARGCICPPNFPQCVCGNIPKVKVVTKKAAIAGSEELAENPRSRSAKLRVCEKM